MKDVELAIPEKLKNRLYPVVLELFSENDFHRVNIREISKKTGISSGTIYKYFSSKEDLIFTILNEKIGEIRDILQLHLAGMEDIKEIFRKVFWVTMDFYDKNPGVAITAFITVPMRNWMKEESFKRGHEHVLLLDPIKKAREKGTISLDITDKQIVDVYYMFCYRHIHQWYYFGMKQKLADTIQNFFELFWKILKP
ncbi:TetR/AcrR family transcriptional regulator [bacterium]|nr:TetR/AcrR family transcriptional regulator [bacterium]